MFLLALSAGCMAGAVRGLRAMVGDRPPVAELAEVPWWAGLVAVIVGLVLAAIGGVLPSPCRTGSTSEKKVVRGGTSRQR